MSRTYYRELGATTRVRYSVPLWVYTSLSSFRSTPPPRGDSGGIAFVVDRDENDPSSAFYAWHDTSTAADNYDANEDVASCTANVVITPDSNNDGVVDTQDGRWIRVMFSQDCPVT